MSFQIFLLSHSLSAEARLQYQTPEPAPLSQWSILDFPDHTGEGPFLRDSVLLFYLVGELAISQNCYHERITEQIWRPPYVSSLESLVALVLFWSPSTICNSGSESILGCPRTHRGHFQLRMISEKKIDMNSEKVIQGKKDKEEEKTTYASWITRKHLTE